MHENIREHMDVIGSDGTKVGTVDHVQGSEIKLTKSARRRPASITSSRSTGSRRSIPRCICRRPRAT